MNNPSIPNPNTSSFTPRALTKKELAILYFPDITPPSAVNRLMSLIRRNPILLQQLYDTGYHPSDKTLTPRQVLIIIDWLGAP